MPKDIELDNPEAIDSMSDEDVELALSKMVDGRFDITDDTTESETGETPEPPAEENVENSSVENDISQDENQVSGEQIQESAQEEQVTDNQNDGSGQVPEDDGQQAAESADENQGSGEIDPAKELEELKKYKEFYDKVTGEFVANGRKVRGFTDPDKLIQAQQMAYGFSEKMAAFKKYKPYIKAIEDKGLTDQQKFNLFMGIVDGDKDAIKVLLKEKQIDPTEFIENEYEQDGSNEGYVPKKSYLPSQIEMSIDDMLDNADMIGIRDRVESELASNRWDPDSLVELATDPTNTADLMEHMKTGIYDTVQDRIAQIKATDFSGQFASMRAIDQYRYAAGQIEQELIAQAQMVKNQQNSGSQQAQPQQQIDPNLVDQEKQKILDEQKKREYEALNAEKQKKINSQRQRASSASKTSSVPSQTKEKQEFDPAKLSDEEVEKMLNGFIAESVMR